VLLLQHLVLVLVFKPKFCHSLARWLDSGFFCFFFSSVFEWQLLDQLLPQWGVAALVYMLSSDFGDQLCSAPAVLLWRWLFTVPAYLGLVSLPCPLSLGQGQWSISQSPAVSVLWWFLFVFQFCRAIWLWVLLTSSGDELLGLIPALFQAVAYHMSAIGPPAFPAFVYWKFAWRSAPCSSLLLQCTLRVPTLFTVC
jgi:hypothetical protein